MAPPLISPCSHLFVPCHRITNHIHLFIITATTYKARTHLHSLSGLVYDHTWISPSGLSTLQIAIYLHRLRSCLPSSSFCFSPHLLPSSTITKESLFISDSVLFQFVCVCHASSFNQFRSHFMFVNKLTCLILLCHLLVCVKPDNQSPETKQFTQI